MRPICVNPGCGKPVTVSSGKITDLYPKWRVHCSHCQGASYGGHPHAYGVTPFKKGTCSNTNERLGFPCVIDWELAKKASVRVATEIDHINGDPEDNRIENLQELCPVCHRTKGSLSGNFNGWRNYI